MYKYINVIFFSEINMNFLVLIFFLLKHSNFLNYNDKLVLFDCEGTVMLFLMFYQLNYIYYIIKKYSFITI